MNINLTAQTFLPAGITRWLPAQLRKLAALAGVERANITLVLVADKEMAALHEQYKNVKGTTDVLTFDLCDDDSLSIEGDLILCIDEAARQAKLRGHDTRTELLLYALHGLLHLLNYNDTTPRAYKKMHAKEDELLQRAGFGPIFASK